MRSWTWKHWTVGVMAIAAVAGLGYWLGTTFGRDDGSPVIAEPSPSETAEPTAGATTEPTDEPNPTETTVARETPAEPSAATWMVTTDGDDVVLRSDTGGEAVALYETPVGAETEVIDVAVKPGSTPEDLTVVFTRFGEGMRGGTEGGFDLWYATITGGGEPTARAFPGAYQVSPDTDADSVPSPVWSPDGRHLGWTELPADGGAVTLRTIGWSDGPGTGDDATDNASFALEDLPTVPSTVEEWVWNGEGTSTTGSLVVTTRDIEAYRVDIERQADGALARPPTAGINPMEHPDGAVIDQADGRTGPTPERSAIYTLVAAGGSDGTVDLRLTVVEGSDQGEDLPVPDELERTSDPGSRWIVAEGDTVLIGDGGGAAWLIHRDGEVEDLSGTIVSGDLVG